MTAFRSDKGDARLVQKKTGCRYTTALRKVHSLGNDHADYMRRVSALPDSGGPFCVDCLGERGAQHMCEESR